MRAGRHQLHQEMMGTVLQRQISRPSKKGHPLIPNAILIRLETKWKELPFKERRHRALFLSDLFFYYELIYRSLRLTISSSKHHDYVSESAAKLVKQLQVEMKRNIFD